MKYKNYNAKVEYDEQDKIFVGKIIGINDIISFHGTSVDSLKKAFAESVDDYITSCKSFGCLPNKPASGRFIVRTNPKIHSQLIQNAQMAGLSTNKYVEKIITHNLSTF